MKAGTFFLTVFLTICFSTIAQVDDFQENIIECLQKNGTKAIYEIEYDNTLNLLYKQFKSSNAPESFWKELRLDREKKVDNLIPDLAFAYRKHFNKDDIDIMNDFFGTETAQIWIDSPDNLTEEQQTQVDSFLKSDTGQKLRSKEFALRKDMDAIASHWKSELFAEKMRAMVKKGYIPQ
jgi:hypothetical protein